ncbi:hypothetical protein COL71_22505 [Bacillus mycoides]|nr:hypothetical protein COL71_22505 [Bacillus mycoides]
MNDTEKNQWTLKKSILFYTALFVMINWFMMTPICLLLNVLPASPENFKSYKLLLSLCDCEETYLNYHERRIKHFKAEAIF